MLNRLHLRPRYCSIELPFFGVFPFAKVNRSSTQNMSNPALG